MKRRNMLLISVSLISITIILTAVWHWCTASMNRISTQVEAVTSYSRHYAMVSPDSSVQWEKIWENAKETAGSEDVYLEWIGQNAADDYTAGDCMRIAIASKVDGIVLCMNASTDLSSEIEEATQNNIPVVTVLGDDADTSRVSFIGLNDYQVGDAYGEQVVGSLHPGENKVTVLAGSTGEATSEYVLLSQFQKKIESAKRNDQKINLRIVNVDSRYSYQVEETIRDLFIGRNVVPDMLVCLDPVSTVCALQAAIDYNQVGKVRIIGYYASEEVLDAIGKGVVQATVALDTKEIGSKCVAALNEYNELGYVSDFISVGFEMLTAQNVEEYLRAQEGGEEE